MTYDIGKLSPTSPGDEPRHRHGSLEDARQDAVHANACDGVVVNKNYRIMDRYGTRVGEYWKNPGGYDGSVLFSHQQ